MYIYIYIYIYIHIYYIYYIYIHIYTLSPRYESLFLPGDYKFLRSYCVNVYYKKTKKNPKNKKNAFPCKSQKYLKGPPFHFKNVQIKNICDVVELPQNPRNPL